MRATTPLEMIAGPVRREERTSPDNLLQLLRPAGPLPAEGLDEELLLWLRLVQHNCKVCIRFCADGLERPDGRPLRRQDDEELYYALTSSKKRATEALLIATKALSRKDLREYRRMKLLAERYDSLGGSIGQVLLLSAPHELARRAEAAF